MAESKPEMIKCSFPAPELELISESKPEMIKCTFPVPKTELITEETPPQLVSCTFGNIEGPKDQSSRTECEEPVCPRSETTPGCPKCGNADKVIKIVFGMPSPELMQHAKDGLIALGGCCPPMDKDKLRNYKCKSCNVEF